MGAEWRLCENDKKAKQGLEFENAHFSIVIGASEIFDKRAVVIFDMADVR